MKQSDKATLIGLIAIVLWSTIVAAIGLAVAKALVGLRVSEVIPGVEQILKQVAETAEPRIDEASLRNAFQRMVVGFLFAALFLSIATGLLVTRGEYGQFAPPNEGQR